jgi:hypothetical protein
LFVALDFSRLLLSQSQGREVRRIMTDRRQRKKIFL